MPLPDIADFARFAATVSTSSFDFGLTPKRLLAAPGEDVQQRVAPPTSAYDFHGPLTASTGAARAPPFFQTLPKPTQPLLSFTQPKAPLQPLGQVFRDGDVESAVTRSIPHDAPQWARGCATVNYTRLNKLMKRVGKR